MPNQLQKSLQEYLSKLKRPTSQIHLPSKTLSSSASWIVRGCKHPKTPSFSHDKRKEKEASHNADDAATLSDIDRFLLENFRSLYQTELIDQNSEKKQNDYHNKSTGENPGGVLFESPRFFDPPSDIHRSNRFFIATGSSSSLMEEARSSLTTSEDIGSLSSTTLDNSTETSDDGEQKIGPDDFVTVLKYSPSPYNEFRSSMQEMIDARVKHGGKVDWEFLEELLFCYLNLNDKKSYKFILSAFVDLIVLLREKSGKSPARPRSVRSREDRRKKREL